MQHNDNKIIYESEHDSKSLLVFQNISYEKEQLDARVNQLERDNKKFEHISYEKEQSDARANRLESDNKKLKKDNKVLKSERDEMDQAYDNMVERHNNIRDEFFNQERKIERLNKYIQDKKIKQLDEVNELKEKLTVNSFFHLTVGSR